MLEQRVVGGRDGLDQLGVVAIELLLRFLGDLGLLVLAGLDAALELVRFLREEVDDAVEAVRLADRHLDRNDLVREARLDLLIDAVEVGVLLVHHRDDEQHRVAARDRLAEHPLGADFDAGRRRDDDERAVGGGEPGDRIALEVEIPWRVDEVDLGVLPLGERRTEVDRVASLDLFRGVIGEGGAVLHRSVSLRAT